jgi:SAM-dependent methyltransferase
MPVVVCRTCGLIQTNPRMDQQSYNSFYNCEYRKLYLGSEIPTDEFFKEQHRRGRRIFSYLQRNRILPRPPSQLLVLEIGCGAGGVLQFFKEMGCRVRGLDLGEEYVTFGRVRHNLDLTVGTIADYPLDESPDVVIYSQVLEHILTPHDELVQVSRRLSKDGIFYVELPGVKNLRYDCEMDFLRLLQNAHTYHFTLRTLRNLLEASGFELLVGDETIRSAFKRMGAHGGNTEFVTDYPAVVEYLTVIEKERDLLRHRLRHRSRSAAISVLRRLALYRVARNLYWTLKG